MGVGTNHMVILYNGTFNDTAGNQILIEKDFSESPNNQKYWLNTQVCFPNNEFIDQRFIKYTSLLQNSIIIACFLMIFFLYALIAHYVIRKRQLKMKRAKYYRSIIQRSKPNKKPNKNTRQESTEKEDDSIHTSTLFGTTRTRNISAKKELLIVSVLTKENTLNKAANFSRTFRSNLKTAFMLFLAAFIMMISYTPALLMSFEIIKMNVLYFNFIYINNASNPIVYSFLNPKYRKALKSLFFKESTGIKGKARK